MIKLLKIALTLYFTLFSIIIFAASPKNYATTITANGAWSTSGNWQTVGIYSGYPGTGAFNGDDGDMFYINGKITSSSSLTFHKGTLVVDDTLIINGDLTLDNNANLTISDGSVLIVYGNVSCDNQVDIQSNSYFVITGNFTKGGSAGQGSFTSNDSPSNVFIGGTVSVPSGFANTGSGVFNCNASSEWTSSGCNYGNFIDITESPIFSTVSGGCTTALSYYTNGQPSASPNPANSGASVSLSANPNPGSGASLTIMRWTGPNSFSYSSTSSANTSFTNASSSKTGYYVFSAFNNKGCYIKDSVYVLVGACSNTQLFTRDNYTGSWSTSTSWSKSDNSFTLPPSATPVPSQTIGINGYITLNGNLSVTGSNQTVCDTLVVTGDFYLTSNQFTVSPNGVLIVLGNFTSGSGQLINNSGGRVVFVGDFDRNSSYTFSNSGSIYVFDDTPVLNGFTPTGDETTLQNNDPSLFSFVTTVVCGGGISGGTISGNQTLCSGDDVVAFTSDLDANPGPVTYQWYYSTTSATGPWTAISGATSSTYNHGTISNTTWFYRRAQKGTGCTANSNTLTITVNQRPNTNSIIFE